ncbi:hypothetical protein ACFYPC_04685 [Streptomyces sp. NPDC005808]|uniref:hypothetical protein n=1 Tax=Streptomyces sp. NPDC005808 TaxID=3364734 RepID=UPI0036C5920C
MTMDGFEVLRDVNKYNAQALDDEMDSMSHWLELHREGIPLETWRALPDSNSE